MQSILECFKTTMIEVTSEMLKITSFPHCVLNPKFLQPSETEKADSTKDVSPNEVPKPIPASTVTKNSKNVASAASAATSKPGRAVRSRKMSRAPQPPNSETPAINKSRPVTSPNSVVQRPCQTHSFHTDAAEVQQMETVLLKLLDDFNSGKLRAFGQGCSMEQMSAIRDQQESLAKLHFDLGARQDPSAPLSEEGMFSLWGCGNHDISLSPMHCKISVKSNDFQIITML